MFPWESAFSGIETCPLTEQNGRFEQHIGADIVWAFQQYLNVVLDNSTHLSCLQEPLQSQIPDLISSIAEFFYSRSSPRSRHPKSSPSNSQRYYDINGVIPPDEYAFQVNNSIYTNAMVQNTLEFAASISQDREKAQQWQNVARRLYMPSFSTPSNVHPEYEGYHGETIKQADVVLLGYPLMWSEMTLASRQADLWYYEPRTDLRGPAMTWSMYCIAYLELGDERNATRMFHQTQRHVHDAFHVWSEFPSEGATNFITGAGGFLQSVLFGYGGMRIQNDRLEMNPVLIPSTKMIKYRQIHFKGYYFNIIIEETQINLEFTSVNKDIILYLFFETKEKEEKDPILITKIEKFQLKNTTKFFLTTSI
eukprot:gb/GECH01003127.1/.p1 GENE.gb/GECH01003127.1/~~gb/GECH01003127.1/.p1  ORF type:complete len:365 (+),score=73.54 gb/GECH01003127.1/:1-1095(+)